MASSAAIPEHVSPWSVRPRLVLPLLWGLGIAFPLGLFVSDLLKLDHGSILGRAFWGRDFVILWTGGQMVRDAAISAIYNLGAFQAKLASLFGSLEPMGYPYPPVTFPIAFAFGLLPYWLAYVSWFALSGALLVHAARPWWTKAMGPRLLAVATPAGLMNIWGGHYAFLHGALFLLGWSCVERRPRLAGVFFGLMLVKPHLAVLVPLALALRKAWATIASATVTVAFLLAATSLIYGWSAWSAYLANMIAPQVSLISAKQGFFTYMSTSTTQSVLRMTGSHSVAMAAQLAVAAASLWTLVAAARLRPATSDFAMLTATLTFLVLPYGFDYDLTVVMIAALAIVTRPDLPLRWRCLGAAGFLAPTIGLLLSSVGIAVMPVMLAALAVAQFRSIEARSRASAVQHSYSETALALPR